MAFDASDWTLNLRELAFIAEHRRESHLPLALAMKFLQSTGITLERLEDVDKEAAEYVAAQIGADVSTLSDFDWNDRRARRRREGIRDFLNLRLSTKADRTMLHEWLIHDVLPAWPSENETDQMASKWFIEHGAFEPSSKVLSRFVRKTRKDFIDDYLGRVAHELAPAIYRVLEDSLSFPDRSTGFASLKAAPGKAAMAAFRDFAERLKFVRSLGLPSSAIEAGGANLQKLIRRRVVHEDAWEMRRRSETRRIAMYAIYLHERRRKLTDTLAELLIETTHQIVSRSERRVADQFLGDSSLYSSSSTKHCFVNTGAINLL